MKTTDLLVDMFLVLGVTCQFIACLGVLVFPNVFDRLHFVGAGSTLGPLLIGAAVLVRQTTSAAGITTMVVMVVLVVLGPSLLIATARAARRIELGQIEPLPEERTS
ncbi:MAG TPA: monovalent cation/H(+) antiporter subunit G [Gaiellaceae bacterium]|nr:monovalent cation/H(+) antiporter subunit G [Gaiellaceae bacterium]